MDRPGTLRLSCVAARRSIPDTCLPACLPTLPAEHCGPAGGAARQEQGGARAQGGPPRGALRAGGARAGCMAGGASSATGCSLGFSRLAACPTSTCVPRGWCDHWAPLKPATLFADDMSPTPPSPTAGRDRRHRDQEVSSGSASAAAAAAAGDAVCSPRRRGVCMQLAGRAVDCDAAPLRTLCILSDSGATGAGAWFVRTYVKCAGWGEQAAQHGQNMGRRPSVGSGRVSVGHERGWGFGTHRASRAADGVQSNPPTWSHAIQAGGSCNLACEGSCGRQGA